MYRWGIFLKYQVLEYSIMVNEKLIQITQEDLKFIYGEDYTIFKQKILPNCFCNCCAEDKNLTTIVNFKIFLNDLNDVVLKGFCHKCGKPVGRYIETGEVPKYEKRVLIIQKKLSLN